ncbi:hydrogenase maturation protease [Methylomonas paludis]|uniref:Hydrogenase maturation protease n=1 Tax=Methylomonas paludis TaxID=1173101 RepID=A0A975MND8_9GAMM|nr:hydrogenase maturation protease [Methylomonas paludis]QWF71048.1 hydrogenase maturation protease [Methylomonas paludis]
MSKPIILIACGNPSRGDDGLGPLLLEAITDHIDQTCIELQTDFQLQIEHALDLQNRELVLFIDASLTCRTACQLDEVSPSQDNSYTSHAMSPAAVLQVYQNITGLKPPPAFLLSIQGLDFSLGSGLSYQAASNLELAQRFVLDLLAQANSQVWRGFITI